MLTADNKVALIHKSSVNIINKDPKFSSPYFVFGEKVSLLLCVSVCVCVFVCMFLCVCVCV